MLETSQHVHIMAYSRMWHNQLPLVKTKIKAVLAGLFRWNKRRKGDCEEHQDQEETQSPPFWANLFFCWRVQWYSAPKKVMLQKVGKLWPPLIKSSFMFKQCFSRLALIWKRWQDRQIGIQSSLHGSTFVPQFWLHQYHLLASLLNF